jgi:hypothetical protein
VGRHKDRVKEVEYGRCILYSYVKRAQLNLLKLFYEEEGKE